MADFILRPWKPEDLDSLVEQANNMQIARYMTNMFPHPYTRENGTAFIEFANLATPVRMFAIEVGGKAVGGSGIHPQTDIMCKNAELGYWLGADYWGRGIMSQVVPQMVDYAFRTFDIERLYARVFGTNIASQQVLQKNGFVLESNIPGVIYKNGLFEDELIYAVRKKQTHGHT